MEIIMENDKLNDKLLDNKSSDALKIKIKSKRVY